MPSKHFPSCARADDYVLNSLFQKNFLCELKTEKFMFGKQCIKSVPDKSICFSEIVYKCIVSVIYCFRFAVILLLANCLESKLGLISRLLFCKKIFFSIKICWHTLLTSQW